MAGKLLPIALIILLIWLIFFHRSIPTVTRRLGRKVGNVKDAGREIFGDENEVAGSSLAKYESQIGQTLTARILEQNPLSDDLRLQERVVRIGARLAGAASRREVSYRFAVTNSPELEAIALPGGSIFVSEALIGLCGGDDHRLAGLLAHEIAHVDRRHAVKAYAASAATRAGLRLLSFGRGAVLRQLSGALEGLVSSGHGDERELEADLVGSELAEAAGYEPRGLLRLLGDVASSAGVSGATPFFQRHPPLPSRIRALEKRWGPDPARQIEGGS